MLQATQSLQQAAMIIALHEGCDLGFKITWQEVVLLQVAVNYLLKRVPMILCDFETQTHPPVVARPTDFEITAGS